MSRAAFLVAFAAAALSAAAGVRPAPFAEAVVPDDASESQLYAAAEFAAYHERIAGGRVEVVRASAATNAVRRLRIETAAETCSSSPRLPAAASTASTRRWSASAA